MEGQVFEFDDLLVGYVIAGRDPPTGHCELLSIPHIKQINSMAGAGCKGKWANKR